MVTIKDPVRALIETAREFRGVRELGSNRGIVPDFANWWTGRDMSPYPQGLEGAPWCSTGLNLWGRLALGWAWPVPAGDPRYSDVDKMVAWAERLGILYEFPERGDLGCIQSGIGWRHIYLVTDVHGDRVLTIEANTNNDGSFNGDGVYERSRPIAGSIFIRWIQLLS